MAYLTTWLVCFYFIFFDQHRYRSKTNQTYSFTFNFREIYRLIPKSSLTSLCRSKFLEMKLTSCIRTTNMRKADQETKYFPTQMFHLHKYIYCVMWWWYNRKELPSIFFLIIKPRAKQNKLHDLFLLTF